MLDPSIPPPGTPFSDSMPPPGTSALTKFTARGRMLGIAWTVHQQPSVPHAPTLPVEEGGGEDPYVAQAVHFDGAAILFNDTLAATDGQLSLYVGWFKFPPDQPISNSAIWTVDPNGEYNGFGIYRELSSNLGISTPGSSGGANIDSTSSVVADTWYCVLSSIQNTGGDIQLYLGDINVDDGSSNEGLNDNVFNGVPFYFGDDGFADGAVMDVADFRVWTNQVLDLSVEANRRLFIDADGKPVDPAIATAALGTPTILFSGDADTFITNQGDGGPFTLTGTLTDASTSPSD